MDNNILTTEKTSEVHQLTYEETREILTPFAFELDKSLFGTPLASPWSRAGALLIDLLCVAILSGAPGELLAIVIAITAYKMGSKHKNVEQQKNKKGKKRRAILRGFGVLILLITLLSVLPQLFDKSTDNKQWGPAVVDDNVVVTESLGIKNTLMLTGTIANLIATIEGSSCNNVSCWQAELTDEVENFALFPFENDVVSSALDEVVEATALPKLEQIELHQLLFVSYQAQKAADNANNETVKLNEFHTPKLPNFTGNPIESYEDELPTDAPDAEVKHQYSIIKIIEGIIEDLGLGFGWAAFYFTVLTAVWNGQTLGKKAFQIKVLQLDGTKLSLWDSFGRYGGYGAGIATGLLGFLQVFWDPNRQAIHDKISTTVVVKYNAAVESQRTMLSQVNSPPQTESKINSEITNEKQ